MIEFDGNYYNITAVDFDEQSKKCNFIAKKYRSQYHADKDIDVEDYLIYIFKGDDYFLPENPTEEDVYSYSHSKLNELLNGGQEFIGLKLGKKLLKQEKKLAKKRKDISDEIAKLMQQKIETGFTFSLYPDAQFKATLAWQFDVQNLVSARDRLTYPYYLRYNEDSQGKPVYLRFNNADELAQLYNEFFTFVMTVLAYGREEQKNLKNLNDFELDNYVIQFN